jgi:shikimate kinase
MRVVLVGYRGTGKTTVGQILAEALKWPFIDTDPLIELRAHLSISDIFARLGEPAFRDLESAVIADLAETDPAVIAVGGGAVLRPQNLPCLRANSLVVWLTASPETLYKRMAGDATTASRRPSLTGLAGLEEIRRLLDVREPYYHSAAHMALDTETYTPREVAERILQRVRETTGDKG